MLINPLKTCSQRNLYILITFIFTQVSIYGIIYSMLTDQTVDRTLVYYDRQKSVFTVRITKML